jgi:peptide/nickel transport system substrate-binding protein
MSEDRHQARPSLNRRQLVQGMGAASLGAGFAAAPLASLNVAALASRQEVKPGGTLTMGLNQESLTIDPHISRDGAGTQIKTLIYSQLIKYYYGKEIVPDLAESYEEVDEVTYVFKLRPGVTFHDGAPLTSADVVASYQRILDPEVGASAFPFVNSIEEVTAPDDLTVQFRLSGPYTPFIKCMALPGNFIAQASKIEQGVDFQTDVIGTGPFKLASRTEGVETKLEANREYFIEGLPYLDEIVFRPLFDDPARMNALFSGDVDIVTYPNWAAMQRIEEDDNLTLYSEKEDGYVFVHFRVDQPPFDDVRVRQAVSMAINRDAIVATAASGRGIPNAGGFIPSWMAGYAPEVAEKYAYDPERAKVLLAEAGAEGLEIKFTSWPPDTELFGRPSVVIANQLNEIGLKVTLVPQPVAEWQQTRAEGTYEMFMDGNLYSLDDPDLLYDLYYTGARVPRANRFSDPEIDALLDEARVMPDGEDRAAMYRQIQERAADLMPITNIFTREQGIATQAYVQGFEYLGAFGQTNSLLETWLDH